MTMTKTKMTLEEWRAKATELFGPDKMGWRFVCPACDHVASVRDWLAVGAPLNTAAFSCVGRWSGASRKAFAEGNGPCDYAGGGLFPINPVTVVCPDGVEIQAFAFAPAAALGEG